LSGGQLLQGIVARRFGLEGETGTNFYVFGAPGEAASLARQLRGGLDALAADAQAVADFVAEARAGFVRHQQLFEQIAAAALE
jgi:heme oxygenase